MYPGSFAGEPFAEQIQVNIRQHALESGCFVVCATAWLDADQHYGCTCGNSSRSRIVWQRAVAYPPGLASSA